MIGQDPTSTLVFDLVEKLGTPLAVLVLIIYGIHKLVKYLVPRIEQLVVVLVAFLKATNASQDRMERTLERILDILQQQAEATTQRKN